MNYGLVGAAGGGLESRYWVVSLESGALWCQAYEAYLELRASVSISFEHAWFLLLALPRRDEVGMARCEDCSGLRMRDLWPDINRRAAIASKERLRRYPKAGGAPFDTYTRR